MKSRLSPVLLVATIALAVGLLGSSALAGGPGAIPAAAPSRLISIPTPVPVRAAIVEVSLAPAPAPSTTSAPDASQAPEPTPKTVIKPAITPKPRVIAKTDPASKPKAQEKPKTAVQYAGQNHFWFPALGISRPVYEYGCRGGDPSNRVYIWGCRSVNNTYVFGHAYGVFRPLQMGYHDGRLKLGSLVYYAGADRKVHIYKLTEIRHVRLADYDKWGPWATGALESPGMTLQTCDGANSQYRILVRLMMVK